MRKHLIIRALHRDTSFLSLGTEKLTEELKGMGNQVVVRDLYEIGFNPVLTTSDFEAVRSGNTPKDILLEQNHIIEADYIWVIFPIWWAGMPAILKGYIDRVLLSGFAYRMQGDRPVGMLPDKKVILLNSMGMSYDDYENSGMFDALKLTVDKGVFDFAGMQVVDHRYFTSIMSADEKKREHYYAEIAQLAHRYSEVGQNNDSGKQRSVA